MCWVSDSIMKIGNHRLGFKFFLVLLIFVGLMLIAKGSNDIYEAFQTTKWESTKAKIIISTVNASTGGKKIYGPNVKYEYHVEGIKYQSNRIHTSKIMNYGKDSIERIIAKYPKGKIITVYYDKKNPNQAVILKGINFHSAVAFACGVFLLLFSVYFRKLSRRISDSIDINERVRTQQSN